MLWIYIGLHVKMLCMRSFEEASDSKTNIEAKERFLKETFPIYSVRCVVHE